MVAISVIIPYFNRRHTIRTAINSVLQQTFQDFEVIVVDDASTDDVNGALAPYADDARIRLIRKAANQGPGAARNTGIAAAQGRFVAFLDSDDRWLPKKLERQVEAVLAEPDPDATFCLSKTRVLLDGSHELIRPIHLPAPGRSFAEYLYVDGGFAQTSAYFLARTLAQRFPFYEDMGQLEDQLFLIEIEGSGARFIVLDEVLTIWNNESTSDRASSADDLRKWIDIVALFSERAAPHVSPHVLLAGKVRFLSGRLWRESPAQSVALMVRALRAGSLSPKQIAVLFGRNAMPVGLYNVARHWLAKAGGQPRQSGQEAAPANDKSILFVTEEPFLPPHNGSQQTYAAVVRSYAEDGWKLYCISFYRDPAVLQSPIAEAYRSTFSDYLLLPGWNRGGAVLGRVGQAFREADRSLTGNVLPSHPFLTTKGPAEAQRIADVVRSWGIGTLYVHKVHGMQLLGRVLDHLADIPIILNLHDDFVARASNYSLVHNRVFSALPLRTVLRDHGAAWLRHQVSRTNLARSRRVERRLLQRCKSIIVNSAQEMASYMADPMLADKLVYAPAIYSPVSDTTYDVADQQFDAGFIGSADVMNIEALLYFRDRILPLLKEKRPEFSFLIAGRVGPLARSLFEGVEGVTIWMSLNTVDSFYRAVAVAVIPVCYGTGVSIRFIESIKFGKPIVSTTIGARGHDLGPIPNVVITDEPSAFATAVIALALAAKTTEKVGQAVH